MLQMLLESGLRSLCLTLGVGAAIRLLRLRNPHLERVAWCVVLGAALTMPVLMLLSRAPVAAVVQFPEMSVVRLSAITAQSAARVTLLVVYWSVCSVLLLRFGIALLRAFALRANATRIAAPAGTSLDVRVCPQLRAPVTVASTILLPGNHEQWTAQQQRAVLAHEGTHVRHADFFIAGLAQMHRAVFWFNPLAWWLPRRLALLSEHLSDDAAMAVLDDRNGYAHMLLGFAAERPVNEAAAMAMARPATVSARVERILAQEEVAQRPGVAARTTLVSAVLGMLLLIAACSVGVDTEPRSNPRMPLAQPEYPADSRRLSQQGTVVVRLYVLANGSVGKVRLETSSGFAKLDQSAMSASRGWRLEPATSNGLPVAAWGDFAVTFRLVD